MGGDLGWKRDDPSSWESDIINPKGIVWANGGSFEADRESLELLPLFGAHSIFTENMRISIIKRI